jgi:carbon monoxide dehydrogenase subunit G
MKFENSFVVQAPSEQVWDALLDVERVAPCMPGAEVLERTGEDSYKVGIKVKVGPIAMQYRGEVEIVERDPATRTAVMNAKAKETRGQGIAQATVRMSLSGNGSSTEGTIATDVQLSGKAAAMGQGVIQDVSATLVKTFAANLAEMLSGSGPAAEELAAPAPSEQAAPAPEQSLPVGAIARSVVVGRLRDPRVVLGLLVLVVLVFLLVRAVT